MSLGGFGLTIAGVRGFKDILPGETEMWQFIEHTTRAVLADFGFKEIKVPFLEKTELFARSIGEDTDIVEKQMYTLSDRRGESLTLRPEATASVLRAYIEHNLYRTEQIVRLYSIGPMFRYERPQKGRHRQFYQINAEVLGIGDPKIDAELIIMLLHLLEKLGLGKVELHINSLGCLQCRSNFKEALKSFLGQHVDVLCPDCKRRLVTNPLRILDCKVEACNEAISDAPSILDFLCAGCSAHFDEVKDMLELFKISYIVNSQVVRGLDYYTRTAFEVIVPGLGSQNAIAGGGRYDSLLKELGGPDLPGIGFAIGIERLALFIKGGRDLIRFPKVFVAALGPEAQSKAFHMMMALRLNGVWAEMDYGEKSLKSQMRRADRMKVDFTLIVGEQELKTGSAILKDMKSGYQQTIDLNRGIEEVIERTR